MAADAPPRPGRPAPFFLTWQRAVLTMRRRRAGTFGWVALLLGAFAAGTFFVATAAAVGGVRSVAGAEAMSASLIAASLLGLLLVSLLRDTGSALGYLFVSPDAEYLLAAPAKPRPIVAGRLLEALVDSFVFPLVLVLPVLFGIGVATGAPPAYFAGAVASVVAIVVMSAGIGFTIAIVLAPLLPAGRVRLFLRMAGSLVYLSLWAGVLWVTAHGDEGAAVTRTLALRPAPEWLPSGWAARALEALREGEWDLARWARLAAATTLAFSLPLAISGQYPSAWQQARETMGRRIRAGRPSAPARALPARAADRSGRRPGWVATTAALLRRDSRWVRRDSSMVWQTIVQSVFLLALPFVVVSREDGLERPALAAALLLTAQFSFDLGVRSLPRERGAFGLWSSAPLSAMTHAAARTAALALPAAGMAVLAGLAALAASGTRSDQWPSALLRGGVAGLVALGCGLAVGAHFGNPAWRFPGEMLDRRGRIVSTLFFLAVVLAVLFLADSGLGTFSVATLAGMLATAGVALYVCLRFTARALKRFEVVNAREGLRGD